MHVVSMFIEGLTMNDTHGMDDQGHKSFPQTLVDFQHQLQNGERAAPFFFSVNVWQVVSPPLSRH